VMVNGVHTTIEAALPHLLAHGDGGAIVITSSTGGLKPMVSGFNSRNPGIAGYIAAKHAVVGLMRYYATTLAEKEIRVNSVHPTGAATPMVQNEVFDQFIESSPAFAAAFTNLLPVPVIDAEDVTEAMLYLCARSGRYITGTTLAVDAGILIK
jgi:NAD(P)-dependent dehydrogenase (short-subunit alcohol dehydrogenase family)